MESALAISSSPTTTLALFTISRALNRHFSKNAFPTKLAARRFRSSYTFNSSHLLPAYPVSSSLRSLCAVLPHLRQRLECVSSSAASFASGGGGSRGLGGESGGGSGGGDGADSGDTNPNLVVGAAEGASSLSPDVIILDVGGMSCGGCAASVKKILESQPQVSSASINLTTETAIVWLATEAKVAPNWQQQFGESLAKHLTSCGFKSNLRDSGRNNFFQVFERKMNEKHNRLKESGRELAVSWALCAVCLFGHLSHTFGVNASWIHAFHSTGFHLSLSLFTLLGPGRQLILDGVRSLLKGAPNMNTLVGLGALSSFTVSSLAALVPKLGWKAFFEEPIMLIAFVLLGRNLEQRAKLKAASDMTGLLSLLPPKARLLVDGHAEHSGSVVEIPCSNLSVGDQIVVLPGDCVPADGTVRAGRSTVDESSFTGEPLPVTKLPGSEVAAGTINLNGTLTVEVRRPGGDTAMGDIIRLVEEAQNREAPVQRLADKVSGHFTYGVMAISAATFMFWNLFGAHILPPAAYHGTPLSLALQLSCSVLVVACPCALGLATPTAVLVGTSLGATRGLLLRGGNILEKFSMVNTIVFDKTGTLTIGRPAVTKVVSPGSLKTADSQKNPFPTWSEAEVLMLAAGVEANTIHPIGKAIVEAARAVNCQFIKVEEGTFMEEPGSGAVGIIENRRVSVGTLDWVRRHGVDENSLPGVEMLTNQSVVYVGVDDSLAGLVYIEDQIRDDAGQVVEYLTKQGINVYMLSGDKRSTAEHVASVVGIPKEKLDDKREILGQTFYNFGPEHEMWEFISDLGLKYFANFGHKVDMLVLSEVKPDEKKKFISELQKDQKIVAMVGDGINDAAALASSHVGVAIGGGVGAASEVSSVVLMGNKLSQLLDALELSRLTMKTIKQNLWWAFAYNIVGIPVAAGMLLPVTGTILTPSIAGALMGLSSIGVMANSLLLRYKFSLRQKQSSGGSPNHKMYLHSTHLMNHESKTKHPYSNF